MNKKNDKELKRFFLRQKRYCFRKRDVVLKHGEDIVGVFYIKTGFVKQYSISRSGNELTLNIYKKGSLLFMMMAFNSRKSNYYYEALTPVEICSVPVDEMMIFLTRNPWLMADLLKRMGRGLNGLMARMESLTFGGAQEKLATILLILARRFGKKEGNLVMITLPLTHNDLASMIGLTRETTSLEMKRLERLGIIFRRGKLTMIRDWKQIETLASIISD